MLVTGLVALAAQNLSELRAAERPAAAAADEEAPLVVWNRTIFVFRVPFEQRSPTERAAGAKARIEALPEFGPWNIEAKPATVGSITGIVISVNQLPIFGVLPGDANAEAGETPAQVADRAVAQLNAVLQARIEQSNLALMLRDRKSVV